MALSGDSPPSSTTMQSPDAASSATVTGDHAITPVPSDPARPSQASGNGATENLSSTSEKSDPAIQTGGVVTSGADDTAVLADPMNFGRHRRDNVTQRQMKIDHPQGNKRKLKKFYTRQNELIDTFLGADDEEQLKVEEDARVAPKIKFAVVGSFVVNFCLFVIQLYAAVSTGSLSLFATAADAFMDLVSSFVMLITSWLAARASVYKYPVGRTRIETIGIILFCALMTTVAIQLLVESARTLGGGATESKELHIIPIVFVAVAIVAKSSMMVYCLAYRKYPSVHVFFIDHRNDIVVNIFGLVMSVVGNRVVWYLDPIGAICIALLILFSWVSNAFEQVETCRAYHAGQKYYVEVDIIMDQEIPLRVSHDVSQTLQRKLEGLGDVERAFVHVDYDADHDIHEEHKPLYVKSQSRRTLKEVLLGAKKKGENESRD
ncbi:cation efflux family protein [Apiospora arundinis]